MEPISMIVGALVAGASAALKDTASQVVKDAYQGLKTLLVRYWKSTAEGNEQAKETEAKVLLNNLEEDPENFKLPLEKKLAKIMPEPNIALVDQAQQLHKLLDEAGFSAGKYTVTISNSQGVQVGDHNRQNNKFK
jgi:NADH pyrophosphatase NudC (nudix superfamily)